MPKTGLSPRVTPRRGRPNHRVAPAFLLALPAAACGGARYTATPTPLGANAISINVAYGCIALWLK